MLGTPSNQRLVVTAVHLIALAGMYRVAEVVRFELTKDLRPCRFSRPVP